MLKFKRSKIQIRSNIIKISNKTIFVSNRGYKKMFTEIHLNGDKKIDNPPPYPGLFETESLFYTSFINAYMENLKTQHVDLREQIKKSVEILKKLIPHDNKDMENLICETIHSNN